MPTYDAMADDVNTALLFTVSWKGQPVKFVDGDTAKLRLYKPDGKSEVRDLEIVQQSPLVLRYRFLAGELQEGAWRCRPYLLWPSANWEGYCRALIDFTVGRSDPVPAPP